MSAVDKEVERRYTPGPWVLDGFVVLSPEERKTRFAISGGVRGRTFEEQEANARLIAAAPDLLEALGGLLALPGVREAAQQTPFGSIVYAADEAIAKAEGRS